jgi:hypothetical protein
MCDKVEMTDRNAVELATTDTAPVAAPVAAVTPAPVVVLEDTRLTAEQKQIVKLIYDKAKESVETILTAANVADAIKITQTIATIIKLLEMVTLNSAKVAGADKKKIALELTRDVMKDVIKDESVKANLLAMYDLVAEQTLETMIDVSRSLNVSVQKAASCCASFF